jgi:hypothetical protein
MMPCSFIHGLLAVGGAWRTFRLSVADRHGGSDSESDGGHWNGATVRSVRVSGYRITVDVAVRH